MTKAEYLGMIKDNKDKIINLFKKYHPYYRKKHNFPITVQLSEAIQRSIRKAIADGTIIDPILQLDIMIANKDFVMLTNIFTEVWFGMPESIEVRSEPGFNVLCNLCSDFPEDI